MHNDTNSLSKTEPHQKCTDAQMFTHKHEEKRASRMSTSIKAAKPNTTGATKAVLLIAEIADEH